MGDIEPDPDEPEQRNSGLPPLPSVKSAFLEQGWSSRPPAPGPSAAVVAAAVPKAAPLPTPPPAFPPPNKTLAGLPLPPAVKWTPEVHNEHPSVKAPAPAAQPYRGEPRLPTAAAAPVAPAAVAVPHGAAVPPPTAPASLEAALFPGSRPPPLPAPSMQPMAPVQSPLSQAAAAQAQVAFSQTAPMAAVQPAVIHPPAVPSMATVPGMGTAPMPTVSATAPTAPSPLVGPSVDVDEFARTSKRGAGGVVAALFASKPRVAAVFFLLGVVITLGVQGLFGSDSSDATQADGAGPSRDAVADKQASAKAAEAPTAAKAEPKDEKAADKVEAPAASASGEPMEPEPAADEEPSSAAKSTKSSSASAKFNKTAATKAMSAAAAQASRCKTSGKGGPAKVSVTFAPTGKVSLVQVVLGRFDSKTLGCIRSAFQGARVPAFTGKPEAMVKSFTVK